MRTGLLQRREKRPRRKIRGVLAEPSCWVGTAAAAVLMVMCCLLCRAGTASVLVPNSDTSSSSSAHRRRTTQKAGPSAFPAVVDLWPSQTVDPALASALRSCVDDDQCVSHYQEGEVSRVALVRTPGRIGRSLQEAVQLVLANQTDAMELIPTSAVDRNHQFSKIVRVAVLPLLLDVIDLTLQSAEPQQPIALPDVLQVARSLVRWHCRLSAVADDSALLTVVAAPLVAHPTEAKKGLYWFLGVDEDEEGSKGLNEWMDPIAHRVLRRIDECTAAAMQVQEQSGVDLAKAVDDAVAQELRNCQRATPTDTDASTSLLADIAALLLSVDDGDLYRDASSLCRKFPAIEFCQDKQLNEDAKS